MNKPLIVGLCVGGLLATAGGAIALRDTSPATATILSVSPITAGMEQQYAEVLKVAPFRDPAAPLLAEVVSSRAVSVPGAEEEICEQVAVSEPAQVRDKHQLAGTAAGAVIGGALGNQVGGGNGKKLATAAGAIVGGIVGKNIQAQQQTKQTQTTYERQCRFEQGPDRVIGYDVTYSIDGATKTARLDYQPSGQLPIVDGQLVTDRSKARRLLEQQAPERFEVSYKIGQLQGSAILPAAPRVGELLPAANDAVVTDPAVLAAMQSRQHEVVAYRVSYQMGQEKGEVRMAQKPVGTELPVKGGRVVAE